MAIDQRFENRVAIKETFYNDPALSEAFKREARLLNNLHHPVLPHVSDFFSENGADFLVMEFIEGEDLSETLKRGMSLPSADVLRWANQLLDALDFLHSQNPPIIHRDIKPQNLKITTRGDIVLLDFGLAKIETNEVQETHSVFGYSKIYSPLEQIEDMGTDARSDIFSLGATGYHLLTGRPPVDAVRRAAAIVNGDADPLEPASFYNSEITPALDHILMTALALNPNERYGSAFAMKTALEYALSVVEESNLETVPNIPVQIATEQPLENAAIFQEPSYNIRDTAEIPATFSDSVAEDENFENDAVNILEARDLPDEEATPKDYASFPTSGLHTGNASSGRRILIGAALLFLIAGGFIAWSFAGRSGSENAQNPVAVVEDQQYKEIIPESTKNRENESAMVPEAETLEESVPAPVRQKASDSFREKTVGAVEKVKNNSEKAEKKAVKPEIAEKKTEPEVLKKPVANKTIAKAGNAKKPAAPNLNSTTLIIVPSAGVSRPRVISDSKDTKPRQSSASEINRFFTGRSIRKQN